MPTMSSRRPRGADPYRLIGQIDELQRLLRLALAEARDQPAYMDGWGCQRLFRRFAAFLDAFTGLLSAPTAALHAEADVLARRGLIDWGLRFDRVEGWEVDYLGLDYHLSARPAALLEAFEDFSRQFAPFAQAWQQRLTLDAPHGVAV